MGFIFGIFPNFLTPRKNFDPKIFFYFFFVPYLKRMSSRNNDRFFENSPRSDRSDSPRDRCRSPCKEKYFTEKQGRALGCELDKFKQCQTERNHQLSEELECLRKQFRCFKEETCQKIRALEISACKQREFDRKSLLEIDNLRCVVENIKVRQLMNERGTSTMLNLTNNELQRERWNQARERVVRTENESFLADKLAQLEVNAATTAAQGPASPTPSANGLPNPNPFQPTSPMRASMTAGPAVGDFFMPPYGPGYIGEFSVGRGVCVNGPGPYGAYPGACGPLGYGVGCGPYDNCGPWNSCDRPCDRPCDVGNFSPRRC